ncbi:MAG: winged helix-turn-helix domain-containing protein [Pseudomonadota bacterium]
MAETDSQAAFELAAFTIEPDRNVIRHGEVDYRIEPKVMGVLCMLAEATGDVVSRTDLIDAVWGVEHGADESLTRAISLLRATFRNGGADAKVIETVPRRGYRLAATTSPLSVQDITIGSAAIAPRPEAEPAPADTVTPHSVKPIPQIGLVMAVVAIAIVAFMTLTLRSSQETGPVLAGTTSIAVLPFDNLSADDDIAFFSRGISEEILNSLSGVDGLRVIGRTSSFSMKDQARSVDEMRAILGVDHLLDGSVRVSGERVRITAQLIDAKTGDQIWSESYDREINDAFAIQAEIANFIENRFRAELETPDTTRARFATSVTPDFETYQIYLSGVEAYRRRYVLPDDGAVAILKQVLRNEPEFVPAQAYLAAAHSVAALNLLEMGRIGEARQNQEATRQLATRVLDLDPENSLALAALGAMHFQNADFVRSRRFYERAIASNPSDETPPMFLQALLMCVGDRSASRRVLETAQLSNPTSSSFNRGLAMHAIHAGEYDKALGHAKIAAEYGAEQGLYLTALAALMKGDYETAENYHRAFDVAETQTEDRWRVRALEAGLDPALRSVWLTELEIAGIIGEQILIRFWGEDEAANRLLEKASGPDGYMRRQPLPVSRAWLPGAGGYRQTPVFREVAMHWNLPDYWRVHGYPPQCRAIGDDDFECQ